MMKHTFAALSGAALSAMVLSGCGTTTTIYDPAAEKHGMRQEGTLSSEEFREIAVAAVRDAMTNPRFLAFEQKFHAENGPSAIPVLKLDRVVNDTDDPDLNTDEMTDLLNTELFNSGKVDVTLAEGSGKTLAVGKSRDLQDDVNFDQSTVAKEGTLIAARLVMRPKVISNTVRDGRKTAVTRTFVIEMADVRTGLVMWKFTRQLGFAKERGIFGY